MSDVADDLLSKIRSKYPQYRDMPDKELGSRIYAKYPNDYPELKKFSGRELSQLKTPAKPTRYLKPGEAQMEKLLPPKPPETFIGPEPKGYKPGKPIGPTQKETESRLQSQMPDVAPSAIKRIAKGGVAGLIQEGLSSIDPTTILLGELIGPGESALTKLAGGVGKRVAGRAGMRTVARAAPKVIKGAEATGGAAIFGTQAKQAIDEGDWHKAAALTVMAGLSGIGGLASISGARKAKDYSIRKEVTEGAIEKGEKPKGPVGEHPRVSQRPNVPADKSEVRSKSGQQAGDSGSVQPTKKVTKKVQPQETLVAAAYKHQGNVETGANHPEILKRLGVKGFRSKTSRNTPDFGFTTSTGRFVTREEAAQIAERSGQKMTQFDVGPTGKPVPHSDEISQPGKPGVPISEGTGGQRITGVAERYRRVMADEQRAAPYHPGEGAAPSEMKETGRQWLAQGGDPDKLLSMMKKRGGGARGEEMARLVAHDDNLVQAADIARDAARTSPNDKGLQAAVKAAEDREQRWYHAISRYREEWHKAGEAQQGFVDVDTGSFTASKRYFSEINKREMTPQEEKVYEGVHISKIHDLERQLSETQTKLETAIKAAEKRTTTTSTKGTKTVSERLPTTAKGLSEHFAKRRADGSLYHVTPLGREAGAIRPTKTPPQFTQKEVRAIWEYAKAHYIGMGDVARKRTFRFDETIAGVARDLGLNQEEVIHAFTSNKAAPKHLIDEMYALASARRRAVTQAKVFLESANTPQYSKLLGMLTELPRAEAVFAHGTVGMVTHAGPNLFRPSSWRAYWPAFAKQWATFLGKPGESSAVVHEKMLQAIEQGPRYALKVRAGLKINPNILYDDWQTYARYLGQFGTKIGDIARRGDRGMDVLKKFRDELFDLEWDKQPSHLKYDEAGHPNLALAKELAGWVNHASGAGDFVPIGRAKNLLFAPSLEAARWARLVGDPIKTGKVIADALLNKGRGYSVEERSIANLRIRRASELLAVYMGALAVNDGVVRATGQKDTVNFLDPTKSDWLRFKWHGHTADPTGGAAGPLHFLSGVAVHIARSNVYGAAGQTAEYVRGKLAPTAGIITDLTLRKTFTGRPLPIASAKTKQVSAEHGKPVIGWTEYGLEHLPIPFAGAMREVYDTLRENGVQDKQANAIVNGIAAFAIESTGVRLGRSTPHVKPKAGGRRISIKAMSEGAYTGSTGTSSGTYSPP